MNASLKSNQSQKIIVTVLIFILWLISTVLGFMLMLPILNSITRIYTAFWGDSVLMGQAFFLGVSIRNVGLFVLAILLLIGSIGGAEYHFRNINTPKSWHMMFKIYTYILIAYLFSVFF